MFYLMMQSTHFIYTYIDQTYGKGLFREREREREEREKERERQREGKRKETHCLHHMGYSFQLAAMVHLALGVMEHWL